MKKLATLAFLISMTNICHAQGGAAYDTLLQQGRAQLQAQANDQALAAGQKAVALDPARWEAYAVTGGALMNLKRYDEAVDALSKAIDHAPPDKQPALRDLRKQCFQAESGKPATVPQAAPQPAATSQAEVVYWKTIKDSTNPGDFNDYLTQYPNGAFAFLAKKRLTDMQALAQQQALEQQRLAEQKVEQGKLGVWTDPATGLMWQIQDREKGLSFQNASDYCTNLKIADYSGWRLPEIGELIKLYTPSESSKAKHSVDIHVDPNIHLSNEYFWSATTGENSGQVWEFVFSNGNKYSVPKHGGISQIGRSAVLCVRNAGN